MQITTELHVDSSEVKRAKVANVAQRNFTIDTLREDCGPWKPDCSHFLARHRTPRKMESAAFDLGSKIGLRNAQKVRFEMLSILRGMMSVI